ncbi:O-antigen polymerase [Saccharococcus thermophilus]|uniref:Oligosaccharide repeat unit polymerase n=1 Tax=Saccharococcus thermophilus TaxID=29396 RepID=A0A846MBG6_9BACL|nr:O-antigen polymerase [Saccharococcus thermophilus]NIK13912.1 oligosaccharide repeat unit polymerase [Saccharococcus thermophilus]
MLYVLIWIIVLLISTALFRYVSGSLSIVQPNLVSIVYYYSLLVSSFIGSLFIVLGIDDYYMTKKLFRPEEYRVIGFAVVCFVMVFLPLSMLLVSRLCGFEAKKEFHRYLESPIKHITANRNEFFYLFLLLSGVSLLAIVYTIWKTPHVPIFALLKGHGHTSLAELRIEASRYFKGNVLFRNIFAISLTPLLSIIAYIFTVLTNEARWKLLFLVLFAAAVFINIYDLAKSPIFFYLIMFLLVRIYIGKTRLSSAKVLIYGLAGSILLIGMYVVIQGVNDVGAFLSYNKGPLGRILFAQITPTFLHLNLFGEALPFLHGRSLPTFITGLFDLENIRSARMVMAHVFPERIEDGTGGVLNTLFVAEAYANFGYLGIIIGTFYVGMIIQLLYICFIRLPKNPVFLSLFVYFSVNIPRTIVGGFTDFLFNPIWILLMVLFGGMVLFLRVKGDFMSFIRKRGILKN